MATTTKQRKEAGPILISRPNIRRTSVPIEGNAPLVQCRFSQKAQNELLAKHIDPTSRRGGAKREPKDVEQLYTDAAYRTAEGRHGIPASAFRNALIRACTLVDFKMTQAKMSVFVLHNGVDARDGTPLVLIEGEPEPVTHPVRNAKGGPDIRVRAMWRQWSTTVVLEYDADQFSEESVVNLLLRAGLQVGVGEGRPSSKMSAGMGWGTFTLKC